AAAAGVPDRGPPHVSVLRRQCGAWLRRVEADVGAGRGVGIGDGAPGAGAAARPCLAVASGPADAGAVARGALALVAAGARAGADVGVVWRAAVVAGVLRADLGPEPGLPAPQWLHPGSRPGGCAVHLRVWQPAGGDGQPRHPG